VRQLECLQRLGADLFWMALAVNLRVAPTAINPTARPYRFPIFDSSKGVVWYSWLIQLPNSRWAWLRQRFSGWRPGSSFGK
jgi:hypothetical protein